MVKNPHISEGTSVNGSWFRVGKYLDLGLPSTERSIQRFGRGSKSLRRPTGNCGVSLTATRCLIVGSATLVRIHSIFRSEKVVCTDKDTSKRLARRSEGSKRGVIPVSTVSELVFIFKYQKIPFSRLLARIPCLRDGISKASRTVSYRHLPARYCDVTIKCTFSAAATMQTHAAFIPTPAV